MNIVFLSPHFPANYFNFCMHLCNFGANVLGIADLDYHSLKPELQHSLTEYYKVYNMEDYDQLVGALRHFTQKYGNIDRVESLNEHWLETDCRLRTDFNIPGIKTDRLASIKLKSTMKNVFVNNGIDCAKGRIVFSCEEGLQFAEETGYPVIVKPDCGVGASNTYKVHNRDELLSFFHHKNSDRYIMEEFITGTIFSFDGLVNREGDPVFYSSMQYCDGVMEIVNEKRHTAFFTLRDIPQDIIDAGTRMLKAFDVREKFFHFEFFRTPSGALKAIEVNMRPPGGLIPDMINFANDIDIYREWANVVVNNRFDSQYERKYHCCFISRREHLRYTHDHDAVLSRYDSFICHHQDVEPIFSGAMGNYVYLVRSQNMDDIWEIKDFVHQLD